MRIYRSISIMLFAISLTGFLIPPILPQAGADEGSCYLKASTDVYVLVYDLDKEGNQGGVIWQGMINQDQSVLIRTPHGRFRYDYNSQPDQDQPLSGGIDRWCRDDETVGVP